MPLAVSTLCAGLAAGLLSGLLGVGGGVVVVPVLVYVLHVSQHEAHGTSLALILFVASASLVAYVAAGRIDWTVSAELAVGGVVGAPVGAWLTSRMRGDSLRRAFGVFLILLGIRMLLHVVDEVFIPGADLLPDELFVLTGGTRVAVALGIGVITGLLSGMLGVGGGAVMIPAMVLLLGMTQQTAQGVSLAVMIPTAISGTIMHSRQRYVRLELLKWLIPSGIVGGLIGGGIAVLISEMILRAMFGLLLLIIGGRMAMANRGAAVDRDSTSRT